MKRLIVCGLFLLLGVATLQAVPFIINKEVAQEKHSLWDSIVKGEPVRVLINGPDMRELDPQYQVLVRGGMKRWFSDIARIIKESGRAEEFEDILPLLERGIQVEFQKRPEEFFSMVISVYDNMDRLLRVCQSTACATAVKTPGRLPGIMIFSLELAQEYERKWDKTLTHEFGHLLGLLDQYPYGVQTQTELRLPESISTDIYPDASVMYNSQQEIGCDDVDGFINIIDLRRGGAQGQRQGMAWKSFCEASPDYFKDGRRI